MNRGVPGGAPLAPGRPVGKRLGPVTLVALCTASTRHPAAGAVTGEDLDALGPAFARTRGRRFVATHHHPDPIPVGPSAIFGRTIPEGLEGGEALLARCAALGVDYLLHGHVHAAGGPFDRTRHGVHLRCQGTAGGTADPRGRRVYGYDLYSFGARLVRRRHRFTGTDVVEGLLGR